MDRSRMLLVGRPSPTLELVERAIASSGVEVARELPEGAAGSLKAHAPSGVIVLLSGPEDTAVAAVLAAASVAPVLALEAPRAGDDAAPLIRTAEAFARQLAKKDRPSQNGALGGLRFLVITKHWDKAEGLVKVLRAAGATVATGDPTGKDWASVRGVEPHVVLLDVERAKEAALLDRLRADAIFKWAVHLPFEWEVLTGPGGAISVEPLTPIVEAWVAPERELVRGARGKLASSLEAIGVGRALRALAEVGIPLRVHLTGADGGGHIDLASGMIVGAVFRKIGDETLVLDGMNAIAAALSIDDAALRSEPYDRAMPANVATPVVDALKAARVLQSTSPHDGPTDPYIGAWKRPDEASASAPSLHLMIGQIAQLFDDDADTAVHPGSAPTEAAVPTDPARPTDPDVAPNSSELPPTITAVTGPDPTIPPQPLPTPEGPVLSTALPVASVPPALAVPEPVPAAPVAPKKKSGNGLLIAGFAVAALLVTGVGITAAYFVAMSEATTPRAASMPRLVEPPLPVPPPVPTPVVQPPQPPPQPVSPTVQLSPVVVAQRPPRPPQVAVATVDAGPTVAAAALDAGPPVAQAAIDAGPAAAPAWDALLANARPHLRSNMSPSDLNRLTVPIADVAGARAQSDAALNEAEGMIRRRDWNGAEQRMQEAYLLYPRNPNAAAALAEFYLERDRASSAVPWARAALSMRRRRQEYIDLVQRAETAAGVPSSIEAVPLQAPEEAPQ